MGALLSAFGEAALLLISLAVLLAIVLLVLYEARCIVRLTTTPYRRDGEAVTPNRHGVGVEPDAAGDPTRRRMEPESDEELGTE